MSTITTIVIEGKDKERVEKLFQDNGVPYYILERFFDEDGFNTLAEIEGWWELK